VLLLAHRDDGVAVVDLVLDPRDPYGRRTAGGTGTLITGPMALPRSLHRRDLPIEVMTVKVEA